MLQSFKDMTQFIKDVANDERIPERDKKVVLALLALIISPWDLIPDWIPIIGLLDDLVLFAIVLDYFFDVLDQEILLSHYPWDMKSFVRMRKWSRLITHLTPRFVRDKVWQYKPSVYRK